MIIDTDMLVSMTDANQNISGVLRKVDDRGIVVILKNNRPRYLLSKFEEYDELKETKNFRFQEICAITEQLIEQNQDVFEKELVGE